MDCEQLKALLQKYLEGTATSGEIDQLNAWYDSLDDQQEPYAPDLPGLTELVGKNFEALKAKLGLR